VYDCAFWQIFRCTSVSIEALLTIVKTSPKAFSDLTYPRIYSFYKNNETLEDEETEISGWANANSDSYRLLQYYIPFGPRMLNPAFLPTTSNDVSVLLMQHLGIIYREAQDDVWFSANRPIDRHGNDTSLRPEDTEFYKADYFLNIIACNEQYRFCSSITQE
jgi:hypothetical protein